MLRLMSAMNNPAGRLHEILVKWEKVREEMIGHTAVTMWQTVFPEFTPTMAVARTAALLADVRNAAEAYESLTGSPTPRRQVDRYEASWATPLMYLPVAPAQGLSGDAGKVEESALLALESLAELLGRIQGEGRDVSPSDRASLHAELESLIAEVRDDDELAPSLKLLILRRLHEIVEALDHYDFGGPAGLEAAVDRLSVSLARVEKDADDPEPLRERFVRIRAFAKSVYLAVSFVGASGEAVTALEMGADYLGIGR